jgi:hypothetical protein
MASATSSALPTASPSGCSICVISAVTCALPALPMATISRPRARASSSVSMNAPRPHLTSSTMASAPAASFLLMMLAAISGRLGTVPVTSRSA